MRRPKRIGPALPPWDKSECPRCAGPTRTVHTPQGPVPVGMRPAPLTDRRAVIVATVMNDRLEGAYRVAGTAPASHQTLWIPHNDVCPEIPRPEQLSLPTEENDT